MMHRQTAKTVVPTLRQVFRNELATTGAHLNCAPGFHKHHFPVDLSHLLIGHTNELSPCCIGDRISHVISKAVGAIPPLEAGIARLAQLESAIKNLEFLIHLRENFIVREAIRLNLGEMSALTPKRFRDAALLPGISSLFEGGM